MAQINFLDLED